MFDLIIPVVPEEEAVAAIIDEEYDEEAAQKQAEEERIKKEKEDKAVYICLTPSTFNSHCLCNQSAQVLSLILTATRRSRINASGNCHHDCNVV